MRSFLALTRGNTADDLKALFDGTAPLTDGVGSVPEGALVAFSDSGATYTAAGAALERIWPAGEPAPFAWVITRGNIAAYRLSRSGLPRQVSLTPTVHDDQLVVDGAEHAIASAQIPGDRPDGPLNVGGNRVRLPIDARARDVRVDRRKPSDRPARYPDPR